MSTIWCWVAGLTLVTTVAAARGDGSRSDDAPGISLGDLITLESDDVEVLGALARAIAMWRVCPQFGLGFPRLEVEGAVAARSAEKGSRRGNVKVTLDRRPGAGLRCGILRGRSITLHRSTTDAHGRLYHCGDLVYNLSHEIGHALGAGHAVPEVDWTAEKSVPVMAATVGQHFRRARRISPLECSAVDRRWLTSLELAAARSLGIAPPDGEFGRPLVEVASAWHAAVHRGGVATAPQR